MRLMYSQNKRESRNPVAISIGLLVMLALILGACGPEPAKRSDDEGHLFVSEQQRTPTPTVTREPTATAVPKPTKDPLQTPEPILSLRGAPQFIYLVVDDEFVVYDSVSHQFKQVHLPDGMLLLDHASSPSGDRVGVLGVVGGKVVVQFFGAEGEPLGNHTELSIPLVNTARSSGATPVVGTVRTPFGPTFSLSWVPQGNAVIVVGPGVVKRVSMSGAVMPISRMGVLGKVTDAYWSPMDSQLAMLTQDNSGTQRIFLLNRGSDEAVEVDLFGDGSTHRLSNLQWIPNGLGIIVVAGNDVDGELVNGQIWAYRLEDKQPRLVATSGQGGPNGTISHVAISPDGHAVAYAVVVRDLNEWHLHSLWVKPIDGGTAKSIPINSGSPIIDLMWTAEGLVWQQKDGTMWIVNDTGVVHPLGTLVDATPVATPPPSPVASPES